MIYEDIALRIVKVAFAGDFYLNKNLIKCIYSKNATHKQ